MTCKKTQLPASALGLHYHLVLSTVGSKDLLITHPHTDYTPTHLQTHPDVPLARDPSSSTSSSCRWWRKRAQDPTVLTTLLGARLACCHLRVHIKQLLCLLWLSCDSLSDLLFPTSISLAVAALSLQPDELPTPAFLRLVKMLWHLIDSSGRWWLLLHFVLKYPSKGTRQKFCDAEMVQLLVCSCLNVIFLAVKLRLGV